jgi:hypothetical protein
MIKLKNILAENMRRFGTKNLSETVFTGKGEPKMSRLAYINDKRYELLYEDTAYSLKETMELARKYNAYIPSRSDIGGLQDAILPGKTVGDIWIAQKEGKSAIMPQMDQPELSKELPYVLFNLSDNADVLISRSDHNPDVTGVYKGENAECLVLLRKI